MQTHHLYIHFPYCLYKCHYCDFNSYALEPSEIPYDAYTEALSLELAVRQQMNVDSGPYFFSPDTEIKTIFFGGGTPSLMPQIQIQKILAAVRKYFVISEEAEITLECNPGTLNPQTLAGFKESGINRISIGVQSFNDKYLARFGRIHTGKEAEQAISMALELGIDVSGDLIFGFPGQTLKEWQQDLTILSQYDLSHASCYALTAEPGTQYYQNIKQGDFGFFFCGL